MPARLLRSPLNVLAAILVVVGLAVSVPASSGSSAVHDGMLIHPFFPHHHGDAHAPFVWDLYDDPAGAATSVTSAFEAPMVMMAAPQPDLSGAGLAGGEIVLPGLLGLLIFAASRLRRTGPPLPQQHVAGPAPPPPRLIPADTRCRLVAAHGPTCPKKP
jgi:hypothetical protein